MTIDSIDFRVNECDGRTIEAGLFAGEDCHEVIELTREQAITLATALLQSLSQIGVTHLDLLRALSANRNPPTEGETA